MAGLICWVMWMRNALGSLIAIILDGFDDYYFAVSVSGLRRWFVVGFGVFEYFFG